MDIIEKNFKLLRAVFMLMFFNYTAQFNSKLMNSLWSLFSLTRKSISKLNIQYISI